MDNQEPKKSKIPYLFFIFFAVIFVVNAIYIYIAETTWRGVSTQDSYQKGLSYNQIFTTAKKQKELGWSAKTSYKKLDKNVVLFSVDLRDKNKNIISDAAVNLDFKRPVQEGYDFTQKMEFNNGTYQAKIIMPLKGQWDVVTRASKSDNNFQEAKRYIIR